MNLRVSSKPLCLFSSAWLVGMAAFLPAQSTVPLESQVFFGQVSVELNPQPEAPYLGLFAADSFQNPKIDFVDAAVNKAITSTTWIHVSRSKEAKEEKNISSHFFLKASPRGLKQFRTHLPVLVIDCAEAPSPNSYEYQDCFWGLIVPENETVFPGFFQNSGIGGVKRRGSSSRFDAKAPLRLELRDWKREDQAEKLLGFPEASDWVLSPPSLKDPSLIRNALVYALSRDCGQYAPRTAFVEVFLNSNNRLLDLRSDYLGVYTLTEKIQAKPGRAELSPEPAAKVVENTFPKGMIFKFDRPGPRESGVNLTDFDCTVFLVEPREGEITEPQLKNFQRHMNDFAQVLKRSHSSSELGSPKSYRDFIDTESWHTWRWLGELTRDVDLYRASSYFHIPATGIHAGLIKAGPVWDFDRSMNSYDARDSDPEGWTSGATWLPDPKKGEAPWWLFLLEDAEFKKEHCLYWQKLRQGPLQIDNIVKHLEQFQKQLTKVNSLPEGSVGVFATSPFLRNRKKWKGSGPRGGTLDSEVKMMEAWIAHRLLWLDTQVEGILNK